VARGCWLLGDGSRKAVGRYRNPSQNLRPETCLLARVVELIGACPNGATDDASCWWVLCVSTPEQSLDLQQDALARAAAASGCSLTTVVIEGQQIARQNCHYREQCLGSATMLRLEAQCCICVRLRCRLPKDATGAPEGSRLRTTQTL
jgi:hypothetical protein